MNGLGLLALMAIATLILYLVMVGDEDWKDSTRWQDYDAIERRKATLEALRRLHDEDDAR